MHGFSKVDHTCLNFIGPPLVNLNKLAILLINENVLVFLHQLKSTCKDPNIKNSCPIYFGVNEINISSSYVQDYAYALLHVLKYYLIFLKGFGIWKVSISIYITLFC